MVAFGRKCEAARVPRSYGTSYKDLRYVRSRPIAEGLTRSSRPRRSKVRYRPKADITRLRRRRRSASEESQCRKASRCHSEWQRWLLSGHSITFCR